MTGLYLGQDVPSVAGNGHSVLDVVASGIAHEVHIVRYAQGNGSEEQRVVGALGEDERDAGVQVVRARAPHCGKRYDTVTMQVQCIYSYDTVTMQVQCIIQLRYGYHAGSMHTQLRGRFNALYSYDTVTMQVQCIYS